MMEVFMEQKKKQISVRIDPDRLQKLRDIAKKEYRSVSGLLSVLARRYIEEFEQQHEVIAREEDE